MNMTTIRELPCGSLAVVNYNQNAASFSVYAIRLAEVGEGDIQIPLLLLGPKSQAGETPRQGIDHPVFLDADINSAALLLSENPKIQPVIDEHNTGMDSIRNTFGHPHGLSKLFIVGTQTYIGVPDHRDDIYFVNTHRWQLERQAPVGLTAICSRWRVLFREGNEDQSETVIASFG